MDALKDRIESRVNSDDVTELLQRLVQVQSYQTELFEKDPMVTGFIENVVYPELRGIKDVNIDKMGNLIARIRGRRDGPKILYLGYAMTAAPGEMDDPFSGRVLDGDRYGMRGKVIWGRGACEQKASLAAMITAMKVINELEPNLLGDTIFITSTAGETGRHDSVRHILEADGVTADYGVQSGEPEIQLANKGRIDVLVTVEGRACHSSVPWEGLNAIDGTVMVYEKLKKFMPYPNERQHPYLGRATMAPIHLESFPKATHTIQGTCVITLDRRLLPGDEPQTVLSEIRDAVGTIDAFKVSVDAGPTMYPSEVKRDAPIVEAMAEAVRVMTGAEPKYSFSHQALDAGYLNFKGIQTICYGAGRYRFAHTNVDIAAVSDVINAAKVYAYLPMSDIH